MHCAAARTHAATQHATHFCSRYARSRIDCIAPRRAHAATQHAIHFCTRCAAELNAEGTDYVLLPDAPEDAASAPTLDTVRRLLSQSPTPLTRQEIVARWPESEPPPHADSLWRSLTRGCELGILVRTGAGNKAEAFRYGLAERQPAA